MKKPSIILAVCLLACADTLIVPESGVDNFAPQPFELQGPSGVTKVCPSGKADNWGNCPAEDRKIVTIRASEDDEDDISVEFERGMREANNGGMLQLERGKVYVIGKKLDLGWLNDVYMQLEGEIKFTDDIKYWQANNFYHPFQNSITFWKWGGRDIKIFGGGTMNGNGQAWYDGFSGKEILDKSNTYLRPILFYTENATNVEVTNIKFLNSPCWNTFFVGSKNIVFDRCRFDAVSNNSNRPKNTDGFDSYNVDGLTIKNTALNVGDDCISPKPNTTNIIVENVWCNGTHGISMGSIGQYPGTLDYITNAHIKNVTLLNGQNGVRLKAWAGPNVGYGYIRNITYDKIHMENTDHPVVIDQCYININASTCAKYPSKVNISDIRFLNIRGTSSGKLGNVMAELRCSPGAECKGIELQNVDVRNRNNREVKGLVVCDGVKGGVGVECVSSEEAKRLNNPNPEKMNE